MSARKLRILLGRFGDGYELEMLKLAKACSNAGFEVVYTTAQDPQALVFSALQEAVDHIGITTLPGATTENFHQLFDGLSREGLNEVRVTAGGYMAEEDISEILRLGVLEFYREGSLYKKIEQWTNDFANTSEPPMKTSS